jgi:4'-phosphopantetheinyl transferase EntD
MNIKAQNSVEASLRLMLPRSVILKCCPIQDFFHLLSEAEAQIVRFAIYKRRIEFSTGRYLAKAAIKDLGEVVSEILKGEQHQPLWPRNIVGSISHSSGICAAVVAGAENISYIGIDFEAIKDVPESILAKIAGDNEVRELKGEFPLTELTAILFCIREAVFKAYYPLTGHVLDHRDVRITLQGQHFTAEILSGPVHPLMPNNKIGGKFRVAEGMAVAGVAQLHC